MIINGGQECGESPANPTAAGNRARYYNDFSSRLGLEVSGEKLDCRDSQAFSLGGSAGRVALYWAPEAACSLVSWQTAYSALVEGDHSACRGKAPSCTPASAGRTDGPPILPLKPPMGLPEVPEVPRRPQRPRATTPRTTPYTPSNTPTPPRPSVTRTRPTVHRPAPVYPNYPHPRRTGPKPVGLQPRPSVPLHPTWVVKSGPSNPAWSRGSTVFRASSQPRRPSLPPGSQKPLWAVHQHTGTFNPNTGTLNPNTGTFNPNTRTFNPNTGLLKPNTGTFNPNTRSLQPTSGSLWPNRATLRPVKRTIQSTTRSFQP